MKFAYRTLRLQNVLFSLVPRLTPAFLYYRSGGERTQTCNTKSGVSMGTRLCIVLVTVQEVAGFLTCNQ